MKASPCLYALALAGSNLSPIAKYNVPETMVTRSNVGCVWTPSFRFLGSFRRKVNGSAAFRLPSNTAIFAPGPTDGASTHLISDALTEIKADRLASEPAQAVGAVNDPTAGGCRERSRRQHYRNCNYKGFHFCLLSLALSIGGLIRSPRSGITHATTRRVAGITFLLNRPVLCQAKTRRRS